MHLQIRSVPALSPGDLAAFLKVLADNGINLESAGGSEIETGGEFIFSVAHGEEDHAMSALQDAGYLPHIVEVETGAVANEPGMLLAFISEIAEQNAVSGKRIRDLTIGAPDVDGRILVQVYSE
jgi:hypothetical protein